MLERRPTGVPDGIGPMATPPAFVSACGKKRLRNPDSRARPGGRNPGSTMRYVIVDVRSTMPGTILPETVLNDCFPSRFSGHNSFTMLSLKDAIRPSTVPRQSKLPSVLLTRNGAVDQ